MGRSPEFKKVVDKGEQYVLSALDDFPHPLVKLAILSQARRKLAEKEKARKQLVAAKKRVKELEERAG